MANICIVDEYICVAVYVNVWAGGSKDIWTKKKQEKKREPKIKKRKEMKRNIENQVHWNVFLSYFHLLPLFHQLWSSVVLVVYKCAKIMERNESVSFLFCFWKMVAPTPPALSLLLLPMAYGVVSECPDCLRMGIRKTQGIRFTLQAPGRRRFWILTLLQGTRTAPSFYSQTEMYRTSQKNKKKTPHTHTHIHPTLAISTLGYVE